MNADQFKTIMQMNPCPEAIHLLTRFNLWQYDPHSIKEINIKGLYKNNFEMIFQYARIFNLTLTLKFFPLTFQIVNGSPHSVQVDGVNSEVYFISKLMTFHEIFHLPEEESPIELMFPLNPISVPRKDYLDTFQFIDKQSTNLYFDKNGRINKVIYLSDINSLNIKYTKDNLVKEMKCSITPFCDFRDKENPFTIILKEEDKPMKKTLTKKELKDFFESQDFNVHDVDKNSVEIETWTKGGVNMIHFLDPISVSEFEEVVNNFDVDEEIDLHRQGKDYKNAFSIRQSLEDFEDYHKRLKETFTLLKELVKKKNENND